MAGQVIRAVQRGMRSPPERDMDRRLPRLTTPLTGPAGAGSLEIQAACSSPPRLVLLWIRRRPASIVPASIRSELQGTRAIRSLRFIRCIVEPLNDGSYSALPRMICPESIQVLDDLLRGLSGYSCLR